MRFITKCLLSAIAGAGVVYYNDTHKTPLLIMDYGADIRNRAESLVNNDFRDDPVEKSMEDNRLVKGSNVLVRDSREVWKDLWNQQVRGFVEWMYEWGS